MNTSLVVMEDLTVRFPSRDRSAVQKIDLKIRAGERVLLLGPSGSGKSTLLAALTGIVPRERDAEVTGTVLVDGRVPAQVPLPEQLGTLSLLLQDPAAQLVLPRVEDELAFVFENRQLPREMIDDAIDIALARTGAAHVRSRRCSQLSGGEQQRVALAAAAATDPRLLLLDEPTALLDPSAATGVWRELFDLQRGDGTRPAMLVVEHRLEELAPLPERLVVLDADGRLRADGATVDVLAKQGEHLAATGAWLPLSTELRVALGGIVPTHNDAGHVPSAEEVLTLAGVTSGLEQVAHQASTTPRTVGAALLQAQGASFVDDGHTLVRDVDLTIRAGELVALVGANGAGKTSLLLGLAGLLPTGTGTVKTTDDRSVGMVFQDPEHQFLARTAAAELAFSFEAASAGNGSKRRRRRPRIAASDPRVGAALTRFGLHGLEDADPFRLSGGQQRRLAVAAMALADHPVLLLDEPTFGQDRISSLAIADTLVELAQSGRGIAFSTHDLRLAATVADRVIVVDEGQIAADIPAPDAFRRQGPVIAAGLPIPSLLSWWADHPHVALRALLMGLRARLEEAHGRTVAR